uniref:Uncharacterized protein n=1 Tax=Parascaris univalens TaxID=6257 RepID=A0A915A2L4_PARUN
MTPVRSSVRFFARSQPEIVPNRDLSDELHAGHTCTKCASYIWFPYNFQSYRVEKGTVTSSHLLRTSAATTRFAVDKEKQPASSV